MQEIEEILMGYKNEFIEMGNIYVVKETAEIFTKAQRDEYLKKKAEIVSAEMFHIAKSASEDLLDIKTDQRILNQRSKKVDKKNKPKLVGGDSFIIIEKNKIQEVFDMKMTKNEKLTYLILCRLVDYPSNSVMVNGEIPTVKELEPLIELTEKSILSALKTLEEKNVLKRIQSGHKKLIILNPEYCTSGRDLDMSTYELFGLVDKLKYC